MKKIEPAIRDITFNDIETEEECFIKCQDNFCHAYMYDPNSKLCKCIYCTGFIKD